MTSRQTQGTLISQVNRTQSSQQSIRVPLGDQNACSEFARVNAKRDLVSKIHLSNDNPEFFFRLQLESLVKTQ